MSPPQEAKSVHKPMKRQRAPRIRNIGPDAKTLGVSREYLWRVITGRVANPELLTRYQDLQKLRANKPATPE